MAPAAQPSPLFWCSKYTAGGFGGAPGFGGLEGVEVQDPSLPCVFSNSYTAPVLHSLPQLALSDKLQVQSPCLDVVIRGKNSSSIIQILRLWSQSILLVLLTFITVCYKDI